MKTCTKCGEEKSLADFHRNKQTLDGRAYWCKACFKDYAQRRHKETYVPTQRTLSPTLLCNRCKERKPRDCFYGKTRRCKDCDRDRNRLRKRSASPEANRRKNHKRRGAAGPVVHVRLANWLPKCCQQCGSTEQLELDHINPIALGGDSSIWNFQWLCRGCNNKKSATYADYRQHGGTLIERMVG